MGRDVGDEDDLDPRRWRALAVCLSALFMTLVDATIVVVALPSIRGGIHASTPQLQWVVSGYALSFGMVPIIGGRLGDDRGRRAMLLTGIAGFVATSALVGLAPTPGILVVGRMLQGLCGGLVNPQVSGLVQQLFPLRERGRAFGLLGANVGVATAAGPVLGGAILSLGGVHWGWRCTFLINVPIGITAFVLCRRWLPAPPPRPATRRPLDLLGVGLLAAGVFGVLFPIVEYDADHDLRLAALLVPAVALLAAFLGWERGGARRRGHPLIDVRLLRIRSYAAGLGLALLYFSAYSGLPLVLSLFLQEGLGFSPFASGLTASSYAVGVAVSAPVAGRLVGPLGRRLLVRALGVFLVGVAALAATAVLIPGRTSGPLTALVLAGPLVLAGLGGGAVITPNQAISLSEVASEGGSTAGGMLQTCQRLGSAFGAAAISAVFYFRSAGGPVAGAARAGHYGDAFAAALLLTLVLAGAALAVSALEVRRGPAAQPGG